MPNTDRPGPIFVVGMNGSGTTMLGDSLDNSEELYVFPRETRLVPWLIGVAKQSGDLAEPENMATLLEKVNSFSVFRGKLEAEPLTPAEIDIPTIGGIFDAVYRRMAESEEPVRWVEHSPMNVQFIRELADAIPDARFVHIIRDGRDVARSNLRRWKKNPFWNIYRWKQTLRTASSTGQQVGHDRYFEVRYEDLTSEPARWMQQLAAFLEIDYTEDLLRSSMPFINTGGIRGNAEQKSGTLIQNSNKWQEFFSERDIRKLESIAGQELHVRGYTTDNPDGDADPSRATLLRWQVTDAAKLLVVEFQLYGVRGRTRLIGRRAADWIRMKSVLKY